VRVLKKSEVVGRDPVLPMTSFAPDADGQLSLFPRYEVFLEDVFQAYYNCRKGKRTQTPAQEFEVDWENNLIDLHKDLEEGTYQCGQSKVFIVDKPVKREIFAASFRDRIVHHWLMALMNPIIEKQLIYDCYACRLKKGAHLGINRLNHFMRSATNNYQKEAWVLRLDIQSFFMSIDKSILLSKLDAFIESNDFPADKETLRHYCRLIILHDPRNGCNRNSPYASWRGLAPSKSLFSNKEGCGLPIGNLTSQIFANFYLSFLDHYIKHTLGVRFYGRYVDDFVLIHKDPAFLRSCIKNIRSFLADELALTLHPKKIYLQRVDHGCMFLGCSIQIGHSNASRRWISNWKEKIDLYNALIEERKLTKEIVASFQATMNSYLGMVSHYDTYRLRSSMVQQSDTRWGRFYFSDPSVSKLQRIKPHCLNS